MLQLYDIIEEMFIFVNIHNIYLNLCINMARNGGEFDEKKDS